VTPYYQQDGITIYHGDCRDVLPGLDKVDLVLTDPPYGINLKKHGRPGRDWKIAGDEDQGLGQEIVDWAASNDYPIVVFSSPMKPWAGKFRQHLVWDKSGAVGGGGDMGTCWKFTFEIIQIARTPKLLGNRDDAVMRFSIAHQSFVHHPTEKPLRLMRYLVSKVPATHILDPFMGSGTTLVAAKLLGRQAIGIEISERYCEIAANRLAQGVLAFTD